MLVLVMYQTMPLCHDINPVCSLGVPLYRKIRVNIKRLGEGSDDLCYHLTLLVLGPYKGFFCINVY